MCVIVLSYLRQRSRAISPTVKNGRLIALYDRVFLSLYACIALRRFIPSLFVLLKPKVSGYLFGGVFYQRSKRGNDQ